MNRYMWVFCTLLAGCAGHGGSMGTERDLSASANPRAQIHTELAGGYYERGQYAVALQELHKAQEADRNYAPAYHVFGLVHAELREDKEADTYYRRAIELAPNYSEAHNSYGQFLCQRGHAESAMHHFETALSNPLYETPERALVNYGACALEKGDLPLAEQCFARAIKRAPDQPSVQLGMAEVFFRKGRWLAARSLLQQASRQRELPAQGLWLGVRVERQAADHEAESSYAAQLKRRFPDDLRTQWLITGQYEQGGSLL